MPYGEIPRDEFRKLLRKVSDVHPVEWKAVVADLNLGERQKRVLQAVYENGPIRAVDLARLLGLAQDNLFMAVHPLMKMGYLERARIKGVKHKQYEWWCTERGIEYVEWLKDRCTHQQAGD